MPSFEILKSEKNRDVLLVEGFLFWFDRATPKGRKYWKCIYCYRGYDGDVKNKCLSRVITSPNDPVAIICKNHNHCRDTVLVEHMKAFGSIRRLASSLRNHTVRKVSTSPPQENATPSTSEPLDLSIPSKRPAPEPLSSPKKTPKKAKRALADVLETLYNRLQKPSSSSTSPLSTTSEDDDSSVTVATSTLFVETKQKSSQKNLSFQAIPSSPATTSSLSLFPPCIAPIPLQQQPSPYQLDLSAVTGQPGFANPSVPFRCISSSWLALAAMSNLFAAAAAASSTSSCSSSSTSQLPAQFIPKQL